jgi:lipoprotein-releasing system permease protein
MNPLSRWTSLWIGWRYLRGQKRQFASFISWVSVVGLGLGVAVLVVVISVMNGFDRELKSRILGAVPHLVLYPPDADLDTVLISDPEPYSVAGEAFRFFNAESMVLRDGTVHALGLYALDAQGIAAMADLRRHMQRGSLEALLDTRAGIVMGAPLARHLGLVPGDDLTLVLSRPVGDSVRPRFERFQLVGTFELGAEPDYALVLANLEDIRARNLGPTGRAGIRLALADIMAVDDARRMLQGRLPAGWIMEDWREAYGGLFQAVQMEKAMMFLLLALIVAVAAFNIVSAQAMLVHEKRADIAILRTMGARTGLIFRMVLMQGMIVAVAGVGFGILLGVLLALHVTEAVAVLEWVIGAGLLDGSYFDSVPSKIMLSDILTIVILALALCVGASLYPARRAAALNPADSLQAG